VTISSNWANGGYYWWPSDEVGGQWLTMKRPSDSWRTDSDIEPNDPIISWWTIGHWPRTGGRTVNPSPDSWDPMTQTQPRRTDPAQTVVTRTVERRQTADGQPGRQRSPDWRNWLRRRTMTDPVGQTMTKAGRTQLLKPSPVGPITRRTDPVVTQPNDNPTDN